MPCASTEKRLDGTDMSCFKRGQGNGKFKGGVTVNESGYLRIKAGPLRDKLVHILVLEAKLGRSLREDEESHHINGDTLDCRPENLEARPLDEHRAFLNAQPWKKEQP